MKKLYLLFLPVILFGQFQANDLTNSTLDADASWNKGTGWAIALGVASYNSAGLNALSQASTVALNTTYRVKWQITAYTSGNFYARCGALNPGANRSATGTYVEKITSGGSGTTMNFYGDNAQGSIDNLYLFKQIDTLWIDATQADDTDDDSTKTLAEAFQVRGAHSGGTFLTVAGTYSESVTIDSSFTEWSSTGGTVTITQVNFNSVTCSVDCNIYNNIGTVLNAGNVTVTGTCVTDDGQDKGYREYQKYKMFKDHK